MFNDDHQRLNSTSNIASEVGHEIGNALAVTRGYLQILQRKSDPALHKYIQICLSEIDRCTSLSQDFIQLVRNNPAEKKDHDLNELINRFLNLINSFREKHNALISFTSSDTPLEINCRVQDLYALLLKILEEPIMKAAELTIDLSQENDKILLCLKCDLLSIPKGLELFSDKLPAKIIESDGSIIIELNKL